MESKHYLVSMIAYRAYKTDTDLETYGNNYVRGLESAAAKTRDTSLEITTL